MIYQTAIFQVPTLTYLDVHSLNQLHYNKQLITRQQPVQTRQQ